MTRTILVSTCLAMAIGASAAEAKTAVRDTPPTLPPLTVIDLPETLYSAISGPSLGAIKGAPFMVAGDAGAYPGPFTSYLVALKPAGKKTLQTTTPLLPKVNFSASGVNDLGAVVGSTAAGDGILIKGSSITHIDAPNATSTSPFAINNAGTVVGAWYDASGNPHPFSWSSGIFTALPAYPPGGFVTPYGINNAGAIVGYLVDTNGVSHGFLLQGGAYTLIDPPGAASSAAVGINDSGVIAGNYCATLAGCSGNNYQYTGYTYASGVFTIIAIPGVQGTEPQGITNSGVVTGNYWEAGTGYIHGFMMQP